MNDIKWDERPKCPVCGKPIKFVYENNKCYYTTFCSDGCQWSEEGIDVQESKRKKTNIELFGVENPSQSEEIKDKKRQTCLKNWGVENANQSEEVKQKTRNTIINTYGSLDAFYK